MRSLAPQKLQPAEMLKQMNQLVGERRIEGRFMTACFATWQKGRQKLRVANAGQSQPLLYKDHRCGKIELTGFPLGIYEDVAYDEWGVTLRSEEHTSELQSRLHLVCRLLLEKKTGERLEAVISTDGGQNFGLPSVITSAVEYNEPSIRTGSFLPAAAADRTTQHICVVYQTLLGGNPRIAFTKSTNGGTNWSAPIAISDNPAGLGVFNPAINVSSDGRTVTV